MQSPFDKIANNYDELFTNTAIGELQRNIICTYLDKSLPPNKQMNILELNCGTGEDAIYFARKGFRVVATDASDEMLKIAEEKIHNLGLSPKIATKRLDLNQPSDFNFDQKFDLVFSNFGGLNCINNESLISLSKVISGILKDRGRIIFVIMPKFSLWHSFYLFIKIKPDKIFSRASSKPLYVNINGENVQTYYYSPKEIANIFLNNYNLKNIRPVGFFIPPSYLNNFFLKKKKSLRILEILENSVSNFSFLAKFSDHFLIDMELKR